MTDYNVLADEQLNQVIAEQRGWTDIHLQGKGIELLLCGRSPEGIKAWLPNWTKDLNAAIELLGEMDGYDLIRTNDEWAIGYECFEPEIYSSTPNRAICFAWLNWREKQEEDIGPF